jgi:RNA polymerase sigma-70 factor (ECF subfamily)
MYSALIRQNEVSLIRAARRLCAGQDDLAQDIVQDTLIRGYEAFLDGRFQEGTNARAWLLQILTNLFLALYRRRKRWDAGVDVDTLAADGAPVPACLQCSTEDMPEAAMLEGALDEQLETALASLPPEQRACVMLVDIEGLEYREAADALGVPIGTIRSRLARARFLLHARLFGYAADIRRVTRD